MRPEKKYGKGLPAVIIVFMVLCSSFTAFAYQPPTKLSMNWNSSVTSLPDFNSADRIVFESGNYFAGQAFPSIRYDTQFTDINGNVCIQKKQMAVVSQNTTKLSVAANVVI